MSRKRLFLTVIVLTLLGVVISACSPAAEEPQVSTSDVLFTWDSNPVGSSKLERTADSISATFETDGLAPGNAVTGWYIIFNKPELCEPEPFNCDPTDMFHPDHPGEQGPAEGDFLLTGGHVVGDDGKGTFEGTLPVGDASTSGLAEVICPDEPQGCTEGLTNPAGALVVMATHDHGPAQSGQTLEEQISSFLGGCIGAFNGDDFGFAVAAADVPDVDGECSTIQVSPHMPANS